MQVWRRNGGVRFCLKCGSQSSGMTDWTSSWWSTSMTSRWQDPRTTWQRAGLESVQWSIWASQSPMTGTSGACTLRRTVFAHVFDPQRASACSAQVHRKSDYWEHDPSHQTWTRHHLQPRKKLFFPGDEGASSTVRSSLKGQQCSMQL